MSPRRKRGKRFGRGPRVPVLDRNARTRLIVYLRGWSALRRQPGQHRTGPLTDKHIQVLFALLGFQNPQSGHCFPSHARIAERANCHPDTVNEALKQFECTGMVTWEHCLERKGSRVTRTSNCYFFRDPDWEQRASRPNPETPAGHKNQDDSVDSCVKIIVLDPKSRLDAALIGLGRALGSLPEAAS